MCDEVTPPSSLLVRSNWSINLVTGAEGQGGREGRGPGCPAPGPGLLWPGVTLEEACCGGSSPPGQMCPTQGAVSLPVPRLSGAGDGTSGGWLRGCGAEPAPAPRAVPFLPRSARAESPRLGCFSAQTQTLGARDLDSLLSRCRSCGRGEAGGWLGGMQRAGAWRWVAELPSEQANIPLEKQLSDHRDLSCFHSLEKGYWVV